MTPHVVIETFIALAALGIRAPDSLRYALESRIRAVPGAVVAVSYIDLATGDTLHLNADDSFHAASTMKVPVMVELFRQVDRGELALDRRLPLKNEFRSIVGGSPYSLNAGEDSDSSVYGWIGKDVPVKDLLEHMIVRSSNLATNALIEIVGAERANETAHALGARNIRVLRGVEDGKAYEAGRNNTTTSRDLAVIMAAIADHRAASRASCDSMLAILSRQEFNDGIPAGLPPGTRVAHKTGQITGVLHDAAIVYPDGGNPYVLVVLTRGISDEKVARELIVDLSRIVYTLRPVRREATRRLSAEDVVAIERAAAEYTARSLPQGEIGLDPVVVGSWPRRERSPAQVRALTQLLGASVVRGDSVFRCRGNPSTCTLAVAALVRVHDPFATPDGARVVVEVRLHSGVARQPVVRGTEELIVSRSGAAWKVVGVGGRSVS